MTNRINLVLPAAGLGSRFRAVGEFKPKPLITVFEIPMIIWVLLNFPLKSEDRVFIISQVNDHLPSSVAHLLRKLPFEVNFIEIDGLTEGPAVTVSLAFDKISDDEALIVANTDQFVFENLEPFLEKVRERNSDGQILTMVASTNAWSYVGRDREGNIDQVIEKVEISNEATVGIYGWSRSLYAKAAFQDSFDRNIRTNNEFYVAPTYNFMIKQNKKVETLLIGNHGIAVHGLGIPSDLRDFLSNPHAQRISKAFISKLQSDYDHNL
jgi:dTDP-glucose pyrophosphorylase